MKKAELMAAQSRMEYVQELLVSVLPDVSDLADDAEIETDDERLQEAINEIRKVAILLDGVSIDTRIFSSAIRPVPYAGGGGLTYERTDA